MAFLPETQAQQEDFLQKTQTFQNNQQAVHGKLLILQKQLRSLREISDKVQRQQAFQQLQIEWIHLQQDLREQQAAFRDLRLDYEAQHALLHAVKQVIQQQQQERRWRGYGDS